MKNNKKVFLMMLCLFSSQVHSEPGSDNEGNWDQEAPPPVVNNDQVQMIDTNKKKTPWLIALGKKNVLSTLREYFGFKDHLDFRGVKKDFLHDNYKKYFLKVDDKINPELTEFNIILHTFSKMNNIDRIIKNAETFQGMLRKIIYSRVMGLPNPYGIKILVSCHIQKGGEKIFDHLVPAFSSANTEDRQSSHWSDKNEVLNWPYQKSDGDCLLHQGRKEINKKSADAWNRIDRVNKGQGEESSKERERKEIYYQWLSFVVNLGCDIYSKKEKEDLNPPINDIERMMILTADQNSQNFQEEVLDRKIEYVHHSAKGAVPISKEENNDLFKKHFKIQIHLESGKYYSSPGPKAYCLFLKSSEQKIDPIYSFVRIVLGGPSIEDSFYSAIKESEKSLEDLWFYACSDRNLSDARKEATLKTSEEFNTFFNKLPVLDRLKFLEMDQQALGNIRLVNEKAPNLEFLWAYTHRGYKMNSLSKDDFISNLSMLNELKISDSKQRKVFDFSYRLSVEDSREIDTDHEVKEKIKVLKDKGVDVSY